MFGVFLEFKGRRSRGGLYIVFLACYFSLFFISRDGEGSDLSRRTSPPIDAYLFVSFDQQNLTRELCFFFSLGRRFQLEKGNPKSLSVSLFSVFLLIERRNRKAKLLSLGPSHFIGKKGLQRRQIS
jgi:hypothetical protein